MSGRKQSLGDINDVLQQLNIENEVKLHSNDFNSTIHKIFADCSDFINRTVPLPNGEQLYIYYFIGSINEDLLESSVILPLTRSRENQELDDLRHSIYSANTNELKTWRDIVNAILQSSVICHKSGDFPIQVLIASQQKRSLEEPTTEYQVFGPKIGFIEDMITNIALMRRFIKDPRLKTKHYKVGSITHTNVTVMYFDGAVEQSLLDELDQRISNAKIDNLINIGQLNKQLVNAPLSVFPQVYLTERPDQVTYALTEGKVVLFADNNGQATILPISIFDFYLPGGDRSFSSVWSIVFVRFIRFLCMIIATAIPALYVALVAFHPELIPQTFPLILCMIVIPLFGCIDDSREVDHRSMIVGLSIDKGQEEKFAVTIQIPILQPGSDEGTSPFQREFETFTAEGDTLWDAITNLEANTPTVLFLGHLKVVTISEEVAREGLNEILDFIDRLPEVANQIYLLIIEKGSAEDFINKESALVALPALYLNRFFQADQKVGRTTDVKLFEYERDSNMISRASSLPLAHINGDDITIENMAVMDNHKMVSKLTGDEVALSQLLKKRAVDSTNFTIDMDHEGELLKISISRVNLKANLNYEKTDPIKYHLNIKGEGEVVELSRNDVVLSRELLMRVNDKMNKEIEKKLRKTLTKMQEINVEPWLLGHRIWARDYQFFDTLNWAETGWQQTDFNINVDFKVEMAGQRGVLEKKKIGR